MDGNKKDEHCIYYEGLNEIGNTICVLGHKNCDKCSDYEDNSTVR